MKPYLLDMQGDCDGLRWGAIQFSRSRKRNFLWDRLNGTVRLYVIRNWCTREERSPVLKAQALALLSEFRGSRSPRAA